MFVALLFVKRDVELSSPIIVQPCVFVVTVVAVVPDPAVML